MRYEIDIFHYLDIYKKESKRLISLMVVAAIIAVLVAYLEPVIYKSTVNALSSKQGGQAVTFGGILGLGNISIGSSSDAVVYSILKSRRMSDDIVKHFNLNNKRNFRWELATYEVGASFVVEVKGTDAELTRDIANFAVANVDKINLELQVSPAKPMIKVLDPATRGVPAQKNLLNKCIAAALITFLIYALFIFFKEYFSQMKKVQKYKG